MALFNGLRMKLMWTIPMLTAPLFATGQALPFDNKPGQPGEWGFRPAPESTIQVSPPPFAWRPQKTARAYELQCSRDQAFKAIPYQAAGIEWNVHCPPRTFEPGMWFWRVRFTAEDKGVSAWSKTRSFSIAENPTLLPLPGKADLIARIPKTHPRLFVRPEQLPELKKRAATDLRPQFQNLVKQCDGIVKSPPQTEEPPRYPKGIKRGSDPWRKIWWGNRTYTTKALNGAATLAFTRLLGGNEQYGKLAKTILMDCAKWDPKGATGYRYNDEAGMPYAYYFSRTYTFVNDLLSEEEKAICRKVMKIRGDEMYRHLCPRHLWRPYASHSNRAWHFLGEVGIAFAGEVPDAAQWAWFAANVFANVYPVWCDEDGGWHEGAAYWRSYISRFTWWADVMRTAMGINAFQKPYFSKIGYYPMYLQPPGTVGGGFGDLCAHLKSSQNRGLMTILAAQAQNPYWQWYVNQHGGSAMGGGYVGFVRGALPDVAAKAPTNLPKSRCFRGTGQAYLNTSLTDAKDNVQIIFKSSPFGTQSHGYESQNSFLLYAFGKRLFIRTGRRDSYGSAHHKKWMWQTKSTNCITVNGLGQQPHSSSATGAITTFSTTPGFDYVGGEAAPAYKGKLNRFTRRILFCKPDAVILFDTLEAPEPATFQWLLHAPVQMDVHSQTDIRVVNEDAACRAAFLWPKDLDVSQTDTFDVPPRERIKLTEYHLTAQTRTPAAKQHFVTLLQPYRTSTQLTGEPTIQADRNSFQVTIPRGNARLDIILRDSEAPEDSPGKLRSNADVTVLETEADGNTRRLYLGGHDASDR